MLTEKCVPLKGKMIRMRSLPNDIILYNQQEGNLWFYNKITEKIWNKIDGVKNLKEIAEEIARECNVDFKIVRADLLELLPELYGSKLIDLLNVDEEYKANIQPTENPIKSSLFATDRKIVLNPLIELLYDCNLKCYHCYVAHTPSNALTYDEIIGILDQLVVHGSPQVTFSGGEIFLRSDIIELMQAAVDRGMILNFISNGTLITDEHIRALKRIPTAQIKISIYGHSPEIHDKVTGVQGSFEKSIRSIRKLRESGKNVLVNSMIMQDNWDKSEEIKKLALGMGCSIQFDYKLFPKHDKTTSNMRHGITDEQMEILFMKDTFSPIEKILCLAGLSKAKINPEGIVCACELLNHSLGNIREDSFQDIWLGEKFEEFRRELANYIPVQCSGCEFENQCQICPAIVWEHEMYANKVNPEITCRQTRIWHSLQK